MLLYYITLRCVVLITFAYALRSYNDADTKIISLKLVLKFFPMFIIRYWFAGGLFDLGQRKRRDLQRSRNGDELTFWIARNSWKKVEEDTSSKLAPIPAGSGRINGGEVITHSEYRTRERGRKRERLLSALPMYFLNRFYLAIPIEIEHVR